MPALSAVLLTFSFQCNAVYFSSMSEARQLQQRTWFNIGHRTLTKMWEVRSLYTVYSPGERLLIDSNGKNGN